VGSVRAYLNPELYELINHTKGDCDSFWLQLNNEQFSTYHDEFYYPEIPEEQLELLDVQVQLLVCNGVLDAYLVRANGYTVKLNHITYDNPSVEELSTDDYLDREYYKRIRSELSNSRK